MFIIKCLENVMKKQVIINGKNLEYELERKKVKNVNLRVRNDGSVYVSANRYVSVSQIENFIVSNYGFILNARAKYEKIRNSNPMHNLSEYKNGEPVCIFGQIRTLKVVQSDKNYVESDKNNVVLYVKNPDDISLKMKTFETYKRKTLINVLNEICLENYPLFKNYGVDFPEIRIRKMVSRWGSCMPAKRVVTFNTALFSVPIDCIEYVAVHEFTHFLHPNHSKHFYSAMTLFMTDWKFRKQKLEKYIFAVER